MTIPDSNYIQWLVDQSMLRNAKLSARRYAGQSRLWQRPYAKAQPRAATAIASVWFTAYPGSIITAEGKSVLATLGDPAAVARAGDAWAFRVCILGPTKRSGGLTGREFHTDHRR